MRSGATILAGLLAGVLVALGVLAAFVFVGPDPVGLRPTPPPSVAPTPSSSVAPSVVPQISASPSPGAASAGPSATTSPAPSATGSVPTGSEAAAAKVLPGVTVTRQARAG